jgi:hypothetical protein
LQIVAPFLADYDTPSQPWRALKAGMVPNRNGAVTSAVLVHLRVAPAHFGWRWRERPALARLAWKALARDPLASATPHPSGVNWNEINFRPAAITHRDIAASALLIASRLALTAAEKNPARLVDPQGCEGTGEAHH